MFSRGSREVSFSAPDFAAEVHRVLAPDDDGRRTARQAGVAPAGHTLPAVLGGVSTGSVAERWFGHWLWVHGAFSWESGRGSCNRDRRVARPAWSRHVPLPLARKGGGGGGGARVRAGARGAEAGGGDGARRVAGGCGFSRVTDGGVGTAGDGVRHGHSSPGTAGLVVAYGRAGQFGLGSFIEPAGHG